MRCWGPPFGSHGKSVGTYTLSVLAPTHEVGAFASGDDDIDRYLHEQAGNEQALGLCQVYVMADEAGRVSAYGTLSPLSIRIDDVVLEALAMTQAPCRSIGGYLLGRLGVQLELQNPGFGRALVARLATIAATQRSSTDGAFLAVDAKTDRLVAWYAKLGFVRLDPGRRRLVLPLSSVPSGG